jgi:hypothetical protein
MHCGAEVTESSTNKQHHLSKGARECLMYSNKVNRNGLVLNPFGMDATSFGHTRKVLLSLRGRRLRGRRLRGSMPHGSTPRDQTANSPQRRFPPATRSHDDRRGCARVPKIEREPTHAGGACKFCQACATAMGVVPEEAAECIGNILPLLLPLLLGHRRQVMLVYLAGRCNSWPHRSAMWQDESITMCCVHTCNESSQQNLEEEAGYGQADCMRAPHKVSPLVARP